MLPLRFTRPLLLIVVARCTPAAPEVDPPAPVRSEVQRVLEHSRLESVLSARGPAFTRQVAVMAGDLTDGELERLVPAVGAAFEPSRLRADVERFLAEDAAPGALDEILGWLESGATAEVERVTGAYEPALTLEDYARALMNDPPPDERVRLVAEWAQVQDAATFFVLLDEALREAAHAVLAVLRPDVPAFEPLRGAELQARLEASFDAAVVTFLRAMEPVPDSLLRSATAEYATEAGQWYVSAYSLAVAEALRAAGARAAASLGGS